VEPYATHPRESRSPHTALRAVPDRCAAAAPWAIAETAYIHGGDTYNALQRIPV